MQFAGYDVRFELGEEARNMRHGAAILPEALRWLWRGYPAPIEVKEPAALNAEGWDQRGKVSSIVAVAQGWEPVSTPPAVATSRVKAESGNTYFVDAATKRIGRVDPRGKTTYVPHELATPHGIALSPDQAMVVVTDSTSRFSWSFQINAQGDLVNGEPFYRLEMPESGWTSGAKGVVLDSIGQVYFATSLGIRSAKRTGAWRRFCIRRKAAAA